MPFTTQMGPYNPYGGPMTSQSGNNPFFQQGQWAGAWGQRPQGFGQTSGFDFFLNNPNLIGQYWGQRNPLSGVLRSTFPNYGVQYPTPQTPTRPVNPNAIGTGNSAITEGSGYGLLPPPVPTPRPPTNNGWYKPWLNPATQSLPNTPTMDPLQRNDPNPRPYDPKPYGGGPAASAGAGGISQYRGRGWF